MEDAPIAPQRSRFAIPDDVYYFNCAYMSPLCHAVVEAMDAGTRRKASPWEFQPPHFFALAERFRERAGMLAGVDPSTIAIVPAASYGLAVAARNVSLAEGQEIVTLADQFPSNIYVWRERARDSGARIVVARRDADSDWTEAVLDAIGPDTGLAALPHCHWADGRMLDLERIADKCRETGAALVLDLTQSLGAMPIDLTRVRPDFAVAASYKWLMGPYGVGLLYCDPRHHDGAPIEHNWINRAGSEDFSGLVDYRDDYQPGARRFDMGEKSNPPLIEGAVAAMDFLLKFGIEAVAATLGQKTAALAKEAERHGFASAPAGVGAPHYLSLGFPDGVPPDLLGDLARRKVFVSARGKSVRITPHLYNDEADAEALIAALASL
ncbi:MAG: aminotransferase [Sphingomonadales bacterium CG12_big_fil_rev_8_21_14_0_65_65_10]|nr:MAG: aminotransferase [Sphingomonadales bacterium CG12_big_fil_rev_8_21_14_0_65_65_10]